MGQKFRLIKYRDDARKALKAGLDILADAVQATLGPRGRNVIFSSMWMPPQVTKDGVTVARQIDIEDPFENQGCQFGKVAAGKTVETAGDGTTTAVVLTRALYNEGIKVLSSGVNPILLQRGMTIAVEEVKNRLKVLAKAITGDSKAILNIALIASNNDKAIGDIIVEAIGKVGEDGIITIEDSSTSETYLETVEGMQLTEGLVSPYFINQRNRFVAMHKKPKILLTTKILRDPQDIVGIYEKCIEAHVPLVIIAEDIQAGALATMLKNFMESKGVLACCAVKAPGYGDRRKQFMEDIAIYTGTRVVSDELAIDIRKLELNDLGTCETLEAGKGTCIIVKGGGDPDNIKARIEELKSEIELSESDYDKEKLQERLAKLTSGVAVIKVGAPTQTEMVEKKFRVEDALNATKCAIEEGIVAGGGVALFRCQDIKKPKEMLPEEELGFKLLLKVLDIPLKAIAENGGIEGAEVIAAIRHKKVDFGLDVLKNKYGDMIKMGVIDPVKVVRLEIENAASVAGMMLTTECLVVDKPEENPKPTEPDRRR